MGLADIARSVGQGGHRRKPVDIITFVEAPWGLNQRLYPVQRVVLKAHYGIPLDNNAFGYPLDRRVPEDHPYYDPDLVDTRGFYKYRVPISDWRRSSWQYMTEAEYLAYLFDSGRANIREVKVGEERREMVLALGRRSGKTQIAAFISAYETYKLILKGDPQGYYGLPVGEPIGMVSVATDKDQAGILYGKVSGFYKECQFFAPYTANNTQTYARFQTPKDIERYGQYVDDNQANATVKISFKSCIAKGLRGPGNIVIILDELAHFVDSSNQSSAKAVYDAITPSVSAFSPKDPNDPTIPMDPDDPDKDPDDVAVEGRVISISSPLGRQGQFYKLFQIGMGGGLAGKNMICIQAPSWEVNPTIPAHEFEKNYVKDPVVFFTEYGAEFTDRTRGWIESADDLLACVDPEARPIAAAPPRFPHFMGIDLGLVNDATAVAIGHINEEQRIVLDYLDQMKAGEGAYAGQDRLELDQVADWVKGLSQRFYISEGMFDAWAGIPFEQALAKRGLKQMKSHHMTKNVLSDIFKNFKDMMYDRRLVLFDWPVSTDPAYPHCPYLTELLELQAETQTKYITIVEAPNMEGRHDDMSDALVRMVWMASQALTSPKHIARGRGAPKAVTPGKTPGHKRVRRRIGRGYGSSSDRQPSAISRGRIRGRF